MNTDNSLDILLNDIFSFLNEVASRLGEPVEPSVEKINQIKKDIIGSNISNDPQIAVKFYMIIRVGGEIIFNHNTEKYLELPIGYKLNDFFECIGDGSGNKAFLTDYLLWARAAYILAGKIYPEYGARELAYKIRLPMKLRDGHVYWVQQDSRPFEFDSKGQMVSHLNSYTVICRYKETSPHGLLAEVYFNELCSDELSKAISETRFLIQPFMPSAIQNEILYYFHQNPSATVKQCSEVLKYPLNTIKKYISDCQHKQGILDMVKVSFPAIEIKTLKDAVLFLDKIGWFNGHK